MARRPKEKRNETRTFVRVERRRRHLQDSVPAGTKAGITQRKRGGVAADTTFPLGSKPGAFTDEWGRTVLTKVAHDRSESVGEVGRCGSST
jgi:hypothetical protein